MKILQYFDESKTIRRTQQSTLQQVESLIDKYDIIVIQSPVGSGKSHIGMAIAKALNKNKNYSVGYCAPYVMLQDQLANEFIDYPMLKGKSRYKCEDDNFDSCEDADDCNGQLCYECPYALAKAKTVIAPISIFNLYSYFFLQEDRIPIFKDCIIIDEAHKAVDQLKDLYTMKFWKNVDKFPDTLATQGEVISWLQTKYDGMVNDKPVFALYKDEANYERDIKRLKLLLNGMKSSPGQFYYEYKVDILRGQKQQCLFISPLTLKGLNIKFAKAQKLILMSGTISKYEIEELGLDINKIAYIEADSEIPEENRLVILYPAYKASYDNRGKYEEPLTKALITLLDRHPGKGIVHVTYDMIPRLKELLGTNSRLLFHNKINKEQQFNKFLKSSDSVLIAAGMSEGIDLAGAEYTWQVIAKVVYPSLKEGYINRKKAEDPNWYTWQTVKSIIQQSGRICRGPEDKGITYILDAAFIPLYYKFGNRFFPKWFKVTRTAEL